jgi:hypothetical protein
MMGAVSAGVIFTALAGIIRNDARLEANGGGDE